MAFLSIEKEGNILEDPLSPNNHVLNQIVRTKHIKIQKENKKKKGGGLQKYQDRRERTVKEKREGAASRRAKKENDGRD